MTSLDILRRLDIAGGMLPMKGLAGPPLHALLVKRLVQVAKEPLFPVHVEITEKGREALVKES